MTRTLILMRSCWRRVAGTAATPVGPSPTPVLVPIDVRPVDSRFNDNFWQQFVFNQHDDPNPNRRCAVFQSPRPEPKPERLHAGWVTRPAGASLSNPAARPHTAGRPATRAAAHRRGTAASPACVQLVVDWVKECSR